MTSSPSDLFPWIWPWNAKLAPDRLAQDILTGWSLISITENNSSAPDTERRIVAQESYGRQIGRLMDAVGALIAERPPGAPSREAFTALAALQKRVEAAKMEAAVDRLTRIREDLALLKVEKPEVYAEQVKALRAILAD